MGHQRARGSQERIQQVSTGREGDAGRGQPPTKQRGPGRVSEYTAQGLKGKEVEGPRSEREFFL